MFKLFNTTDNTVSYTSDESKFELRGNRTGVFQANVSSGDSITLQSRIDSSFDWVDVVTIADANDIQEVILSPYFRVVVTNTSGNAVVAGLHG